ncbi:hypothetical protein ASE94_01700 [Devosia sp. Leaf64]|nr:hypothetical protein ASE94_01700 [Devosia sp. Leaf64]
MESITYEVNCDDLVLTAKMITKKDETRGISANLESLKISMQTFFCSPLGRFSSNFDAGWKIRFNIHNNENSDVYGFWIVNCDTTQDVLSTS